MKHFLNLALSLGFWISVVAQNPETIDKNYYAAPLKVPFFLAGNFAELRPNHFHAGIDIKTQGKTGLPVYAAADGYISRISVSPSGYGNVLYVNHPNGTTTVYGHLESFEAQIAKYVRKIQYEKEVFAIDEEIPEGTFPVKKGEQIAKSGNSGSSGGPHLHFEIRRTKEQVVLNPLLFNMPVKDKSKPVVQSLMIYPVSEDATVSGKQTPQKFETVLSGSAYQIKANPTIQVYGKIGFGLQSVDILDGSPNKCGIYTLKLMVDNELIYSFTMDDFPQNGSKYVNSHMDYEQSLRTGKRLYRTWLQPGNKLDIYDTVEKRGLFKATDNELHKVKYEIADAYGNETSLSFNIQSKEIQVIPQEAKGELFKYNHNNRIRNDELEFEVPEGALYDDVDFLYKKKPALPKFYSPVYQLHNAYVPLHFACPLKIKAELLPANLQEKAMLAQIDPTSGKIYSATGKYNDGWVEGNIKVLGSYAIAVDTEAPKIASLTIGTKKPQKEISALKFKVTDNLSGIESFRGTIDGKWVLFEYDQKNNLLSYTFDKERFQFNKNHVLNLEVTDNKGNKKVYTANFHK
jgi:hypothetical protein